MFSLSGRTYPVRRTLRHQCGKATQVLRDSRQCEFIVGTAESTQPKSSSLRIRFRWANSTSTFFRLRRERLYSAVVLIRLATLRDGS